MGLRPWVVSFWAPYRQNGSPSLTNLTALYYHRCSSHKKVTVKTFTFVSNSWFKSFAKSLFSCMLVHELIGVQVMVLILMGALCWALCPCRAQHQEELMLALQVYGDPLYLLMHATARIWTVSIVSGSNRSRLPSIEESENEWPRPRVLVVHSCQRQKDPRCKNRRERLRERFLLCLLPKAMEREYGKE